MNENKTVCSDCGYSRRPYGIVLCWCDEQADAAAQVQEDHDSMAEATTDRQIFAEIEMPQTTDFTEIARVCPENATVAEFFPGIVGDNGFQCGDRASAEKCVSLANQACKAKKMVDRVYKAQRRILAEVDPITGFPRQVTAAIATNCPPSEEGPSRQPQATDFTKVAQMSACEYEVFVMLKSGPVSICTRYSQESAEKLGLAINQAMIEYRTKRNTWERDILAKKLVDEVLAEEKEQEKEISGGYNMLDPDSGRD